MILGWIGKREVYRGELPAEKGIYDGRVNSDRFLENEAGKIPDSC